MKLNKDIILARLQSILPIFRRYRLFLFMIAFLGIYIFLVMRINQLTQSEPPLTSVDDQQKVIKPLKIDQESINKMLQLEDQNIETKSLFKQARDNPFGE